MSFIKLKKLKLKLKLKLKKLKLKMKPKDLKIIIFLPYENVCGTVENTTSLYKTHSKVPENPCIVVDSFNVNDA